MSHYYELIIPDGIKMAKSISKRDGMHDLSLLQPIPTIRGT